MKKRKGREREGERARDRRSLLAVCSIETYNAEQQKLPQAEGRFREAARDYEMTATEEEEGRERKRGESARATLPPSPSLSALLLSLPNAFPTPQRRWNSLHYMEWYSHSLPQGERGREGEREGERGGEGVHKGGSRHGFCIPLFRTRFLSALCSEATEGGSAAQTTLITACDSLLTFAGREKRPAAEGERGECRKGQTESVQPNPSPRPRPVSVCTARGRRALMVTRRLVV